MVRVWFHCLLELTQFKFLYLSNSYTFHAICLMAQFSSSKPFHKNYIKVNSAAFLMKIKKKNKILLEIPSGYIEAWNTKHLNISESQNHSQSMSTWTSVWNQNKNIRNFLTPSVGVQRPSHRFGFLLILSKWDGCQKSILSVSATSV